jgi:hypothetical protein
MFYLQEQETFEMSEQEAMMWIQEAITDEQNKNFREQLHDPIISVLETPKGKKEYVRLGTEFLEANMDMLAKEYPTKAVVFPRTYVDKVFELFGFRIDEFKKILKELMKQVSDKTSFQTIIATPTNVIHALVLYYSDMINHRQLRDSARQQLSLSAYNNIFNKYFPPPHPNEAVMGYVYSKLDNSWGIVKSENVINWIGNTTETAFAFFRTKMLTNMSMGILVLFLNRIRTSFNQNMKLLANQYFDELNNGEGNMIGDDIDGNSEYVMTKSTIRLVDNLMRKIKEGDALYTKNNETYAGIARLKNVKAESLYTLAQKVEHSDIRMIMNTILYVFLSKENNSIEDINSSKYIARITNFPTAIDRAIEGKPIILPMSKKYNTDSSIVKAYICFVATYILARMNDVTK